jgi:hypothetical protein
MPNPWTDESRDDRWEIGLPELMMQQLRTPAALRWLKEDAKPATMSLGTFALRSMFNASLITLIVEDKHKDVIRRYVRTWPELLTAVLREEGLLTPAEAILPLGRAPDDRQPPAKGNGR